jgi:FAD binding domain-containing protein/berberine-like enzyme
MGRFTRRNFLKQVAATAIFAPGVFSARAAMAQLPALPNLPSTDALLLRPGDAQFADYQTSFNTRTALTPQLRALCKTAGAVGVMIDWCRSNNLPFALRSGGHSYEGFSQSSSVVIDTRLINAITVDKATKSATVGAGASLGQVYKAIAARGLAFPGGSCPTVGVSGHVLGGGYGYLARPHGLACDNVLSIDLVNAHGQKIHADAQQNADVFWACRGGGGGSFGAVTGYKLHLLELASVFTFNIKFPQLSVQRAAAIMKEWQAWAPHAPQSIDSNLVIEKDPNGGIMLRCAGQSIGSSQELQRELKFLSSTPPVRRTYLDSITYFAGGQNGWNYPSYAMKGKSDYATSPLTDSGLWALMNAVSTSAGIYVICDSYGGTIANTAPDATAFAHRNGTLYCLQYGSVWTSPNDTPRHLSEMRSCYAAMRPFVSGAAYVNYCDLDLADWQTAYWGQNLTRLKQIKSSFDPDNVFHHAQSVPLA